MYLSSICFSRDSASIEHAQSLLVINYHRIFAKIYIRHKKETKTISVSELYDRDDKDHLIPFDPQTFDENRLYFVRECERKCKVNHKHYRSVQVLG